MILGMAGKHVRHARLDAKPNERQQPLLRPRLGSLELVVAQLHAGLAKGIGRVRLGEGHGHVHVHGAHIERRVEDRLVEDRVN